jgi:hypothetical protein
MQRDIAADRADRTIIFLIFVLRIAGQQLGMGGPCGIRIILVDFVEFGDRLIVIAACILATPSA